MRFLMDSVSSAGAEIEAVAACAAAAIPAFPSEIGRQRDTTAVAHTGIARREKAWYRSFALVGNVEPPARGGSALSRIGSTLLRDRSLPLPCR